MHYSLATTTVHKLMLTDTRKSSKLMLTDTHKSSKLMLTDTRKSCHTHRYYVLVNFFRNTS